MTLKLVVYLDGFAGTLFWQDVSNCLGSPAFVSERRRQWAQYSGMMEPIRNKWGEMGRVRGDIHVVDVIVGIHWVPS